MPIPLPMRIQAIVATLVVLLAGAGCKSTSTLPNDPRQMPEMLPSATRGGSDSTGFSTNLRAINGSAAAGSVQVGVRQGQIAVALFLSGVPAGIYTWAFHATGNCSSPNGFSAGPGWTPAGVNRPPSDVLPEFVVNADRNTTVTARVRSPDIRGDAGLNGRSVLIYQGGGIQPIKPGVPNNAVACGVLEPAKPLF